MSYVPQVNALMNNISNLKEQMQGLNPTDPNQQQLLAIQHKMDEDMQKLATLLYNPKIPQNIKDQLGRAYGDLCCTDQCMTDILKDQAAPTEFGTAVKEMGKAWTNLNKIVHPNPSTAEE